MQIKNPSDALIKKIGDRFSLLESDLYLFPKEKDNYDLYLRYCFDSPVEISNWEKQILERDLHTCKFCGFRSVRFQVVVSLDGDFNNIDNLVTACIYCHSYYYASFNINKDNGHLIYAPEFSQVDIHHLAREYYFTKFSNQFQSGLAESIKDKIENLKQKAEQYLSEKEEINNSEKGLMKLVSLSKESLKKIRWFPDDKIIYSNHGKTENIFHKVFMDWSCDQFDSFEKNYPFLSLFLDKYEVDASKNDSIYFSEESLFKKFNEHRFKVAQKKDSKFVFEIFEKVPEEKEYKYVGFYEVLWIIEPRKISVMKVYNLLCIMNRINDLIDFTNLTNERILLEIVKDDEEGAIVNFNAEQGDNTITENARLNLDAGVFNSNG